MDQFLAMAFAQLTWRESLRDIEACLRSVQPHLYHMGFRGRVSRSTLADANESHDWRIWADLAQVVIGIARPLYIGDPIDVDLNETVYALDSTTIDLCLSLFPWARFRANKAAIKLHTLLDLRGSIPTFIRISNGRVHDVKILDEILPEAGSFYVMDRGYLDFKRLYVFVLASAFFVTRTKKNVKFRRRRSLAVVPDTGVISDHIVVLANYESAVDYPDPLRRVFVIRIQASGWHSSPTISTFRRSRSPSSTTRGGEWNSFSNGSSSIFGSRHSSAKPRTPLRPRYGSQSSLTSLWRS